MPKKLLKEQSVELIQQEMFTFLRSLPLEKGYFDYIEYEKLEKSFSDKLRTATQVTVPDPFCSE